MKTFEILQQGHEYSIQTKGEAIDGVLVGSATGGILKGEIGIKDGSGRVIATAKQNLAQTRFECHGAAGELLGEVTFPWFSIGKTFALHLGERELPVREHDDEFTCVDESGATLMRIRLENHLLSNSRTHVSCEDALPHEIALLSALALRERRA